MAVVAPVSGFQLEALAPFPSALARPSAAPEPKSSLLPDMIVFSSAPMRVLSDLAASGLRQLAGLLPLIEQAVSEETTLLLGHLSKAAGTAARQITEGHQALLAEGSDRVAAAIAGRVLPDRSGGAVVETKQLLRSLARQIGADAQPAAPRHESDILRTIARQIGAVDHPEPRISAQPDRSPIQRWLSEAEHLLRSTGEALHRAEEHLRPMTADARDISSGPPASNVLTEIVTAQAQIALAHSAVGQTRTTVRGSDHIAALPTSLESFVKAATLLGLILIAATLWAIGGLLSVATGTAALLGGAVWLWRISRAMLGVTLGARS